MEDVNKQIMTLSKYIKNPDIYGTGSVNISAVRQNYESRYNKLLQDHKYFTVTKTSNNEYMFVNVKVPSETVKEVLYDVVIRFNKEGRPESSDIKFFSNIAAFTFSHAYIYDSYNLLIPELLDKLPEEIMLPADMKNKNNILTYEKSIFYACNYLYNNYKLLYKPDSMNFTKFMDSISSLDSKLKEYNIASNKMKIEKKKLKDSLKTSVKLDKKGNVKIRTSNKSNDVIKSSVNKIGRSTNKVSSVNKISRSTKKSTSSINKIKGHK